MNTDTFDLRPLLEGEQPNEDEVLVTGEPQKVRRLARNLKAMKKAARKTARDSRKKNR